MNTVIIITSLFMSLKSEYVFEGFVDLRSSQNLGSLVVVELVFYHVGSWVVTTNERVERRVACFL